MTKTELISDHHLIFAYDEAQATQYPHYTYVYKIGNWEENREVVEAYEFYERRKRDFISHDLTQC